MKEFIIGSNEAGQRFDKYLKKLLNQAPPSFIYKMLRKKNIVLNEKKAAGTEILVQKDSVKLYLSDETFEKFSAVKKIAVKKRPVKLDIIYEDDNILLINKPAGVLSQKAAPGDDSINERCISYLAGKGEVTNESLKTFTPSICNRLDRNTSGLLIAGKSLSGLQQMGKLLKNRTLHKYYICIVHGVIREKKTVKGYLYKNESTNRVVIAKEAKDNRYMPIWTEYAPLAENGNYTLLCVRLITGKAHQIRAHLASEGHGIVGDQKYGNPSVNRYFCDTYHVKSQLLHAYLVIFPHMEGKLSDLSEKHFIASPDNRLQFIIQSEFKEITDLRLLEELVWQHGTAGA